MEKTNAPRTERNNRIINGVMSGKAPVLLLCPTSPSYLDCLPDLVNNYRTVFYYDAAWETQIGFLLCMAKKILSEEEYERAVCFQRCLTDDRKSALVKKILSEIASIPNDCLMFFCGLEKLKGSFDMSMLEILLSECPDNLKIVFCSTSIPRINYQIESKFFPRIVICDREGDELPFEGSVLSDGYFSRKQLECMRDLSCLDRVHKEFVEKQCNGLCEGLNALGRTFRSLVLTLGEYYVFHPRLKEYLEKDFGKADEAKIKGDYVRFFYETKRYVLALEKAVVFGEIGTAEKAVEALFLSDREDYVYLFFLENTMQVTSSSLCETLQKSVRNEIEEALKLSEKIQDETVRKRIYYALSFQTDRRKEVFSTFCNEIADDFESILKYVLIIYLLNYSEKKQLGAIPGFLEWTNKTILPTTTDPSYLHFISRLHSAAGSYASAKLYLEKIKTLCDYYSYSYVQSWTFFFNMSIDTVGSYAQETSNKFLECCAHLYRGNKTQALACLKSIDTGELFSSDSLLGTALKSMFYGEAGNPEFGKSLSLLYAVACERERREESNFLYISLAYCEWLLRNNANALSYIKYSKVDDMDAFFSFFAKALTIHCTMDRERPNVVDKEVEELFSMAKTSGYENAVIVLRSCFLPLIKYAKDRNICAEYVTSIYSILAQKRSALVGKKTIQIKFFGHTAVYADRREISWKTKKCKELFLFYKLYPNGTDRNGILSEIWSDYVYTSAVNNLKTTNNLIRKTLKEYGIPFEFSYANGKYKLTADYAESDYDTYNGLVKEYGSVRDIRKKSILVSRMIAYVEEGFASDCEVPLFKERNRSIKEEVSVFLSALIKDLIKEDNYTEAKRFLIKLERMGLFDCEKLRTEIDKMVYKK